MQDRRITTRLLGERLGVGKEAARQILERDLQKRKICSRVVPHALTAEQRAHRVQCCLSFIEFVAGDESWCFQSILKRNDKAWNGVERILPVRSQKSRVKTMLIFFFFSMLPELSTASLFFKAPQ
jgi:hypothetical protein